MCTVDPTDGAVYIFKNSSGTFKLVGGVNSTMAKLASGGWLSFELDGETVMVLPQQSILPFHIDLSGGKTQWLHDGKDMDNDDVGPASLVFGARTQYTLQIINATKRSENLCMFTFAEYTSPGNIVVPFSSEKGVQLRRSGRSLSLFINQRNVWSKSFDDDIAQVLKPILLNGDYFFYKCVFFPLLLISLILAM